MGCIPSGYVLTRLLFFSFSFCFRPSPKKKKEYVNENVIYS